jgi:hypothetical protein
MKAGTTSLWAYLSKHPDVFLPAEKEPSFFVEGPAWERGVEWYKRFFEGAGSYAAAGEASTNYTKAHRFKEVPERIASLLPDVRLVYLMRHPVERMISHYFHMRATSSEQLPVEKALRAHPTYLHTSRYAFQLDGYLKAFPRRNLLLLTTDSLRDRPTETLDTLFSFLGLDPSRYQGTSVQRLHVSADKPIRRLPAARAERSHAYRALRRVTPHRARRLYNKFTTTSKRVTDVKLSDGLREEIETALRPEIAALRRLMPDDFDGWGIG